MSNPFIGQITMFGFNFPPRGWALCNGQLLPINQNQALFSLLGTTYGGNGTTTFALPNLQGRVPVQFGAASSGSTYQLGQQSGSENVTLLATQLPQHTHPVVASGNAPTQGALSNALWATAANIPYASSANAAMGVGTARDGGENLCCGTAEGAVTGDVAGEGGGVEVGALIGHPVVPKHPANGVGLSRGIAGFAGPGIDDDFADVVRPRHVGCGVDVPDLLMFACRSAGSDRDDLADAFQKGDAVWAVTWQSWI